MQERAVSLGARYGRVRLARWPRPRPRAAGYTLLVPVPGDLPVFLELALAVLATQRHEHRIATIVVPDQLTTETRAIVARHRPQWVGPLELVPLPPPERWVLPHLKNPSRNYGMQLVAGVPAARSSHVVLHDAALFLPSPSALDSQYRACRDRGLACLGVDVVWDKWYAEHGRQLAATWELCAEVDWLRSWPPYLHIGHEAELWGERHGFDITLHPQALTEPDRIDVNAVEGGIVHFNYVISTYRAFQKQGAGMVDAKFRLLLVRLFVDLFASDSEGCVLPTLHELADGLAGGGVVRYPSADDGRDDYVDFRRHLE